MRRDLATSTPREEKASSENHKVVSSEGVVAGHPKASGPGRVGRGDGWCARPVHWIVTEPGTYKQVG